MSDSQLKNISRTTLANYTIPIQHHDGGSQGLVNEVYPNAKSLRLLALSTAEPFGHWGLEGLMLTRAELLANRFAVGNWLPLRMLQ
jgi:hypothetical protein